VVLAESPRVGAGVRTDRANLALLEQMSLVIQGGDVAEMDARDRQRPATVQRLQRRQHQVADRCEQDRGVELHRWRIGGALCGRRASSSASPLRRDATRHYVHLGALSQRDLRGDMRAAAETVDAQPAAGRKRRTLQ